MATSSFTKEFVFRNDAVKKYEQYQAQPGVEVPSTSADKMKEGKEALKRFSPPSKKS